MIEAKRLYLKPRELFCANLAEIGEAFSDLKSGKLTRQIAYHRVYKNLRPFLEFVYEHRSDSRFCALYRAGALCTHVALGNSVENERALAPSDRQDFFVPNFKRKQLIVLVVVLCSEAIGSATTRQILTRQGVKIPGPSKFEKRLRKAMANLKGGRAIA
ncbi:hypothetical protein [Anaerovibrio lipolyticus]|uniref:hypothetical protein n=1 Tax=Anaerovibrio lipolyticus TaxID=82374 RepID=UPI0026E96FE2|nr:hypothetical protein [Anaerovibrio lipolyticus]MBE6106589.1 hypothetical protein [Anaerovibrio lipolyticus]